MGEVGDNRKIALVAILGVSPAVLTEAVWALAHQEAPVVPDEILVLTTGMGLKNLDEQIQIDKKKGVWASLKHDLEADGVSVEGKLNVRVELFLGEDNKPTEDLPTEATNLRAADKMMKELRDYTDDEGWIVYGLLAGGRKTMSALFFSCMCLLGRRDDRIYHVLVSEGYENRLDPPFCYPQKGVVHCGKIRNPKIGRKGALPFIDVKLKSEDGKINLFNVPFVCMGEWCQKKCRGKRLSYARLIDAVGESMDAELLPSIRVDFSDKGGLWLDNEKVKLSESEFMLFVELAQGMSSERALGNLGAIQEYIALNDKGEDDLDACSCSWLSRFAGISSDKKVDTNGATVYFRIEIKDPVKREETINHDLAQRLFTLKKKLPPVLYSRLREGRSLMVDIDWCHLDAVHNRILALIFPDGKPQLKK